MSNMNNSKQGHDVPRRKFINTGLLAMGAVTVSMIPGSATAGELFSRAKQYTVQDVIDLILDRKSVV